MENLTFYGTDASNEISLLEYGLLVSNEEHKDGSKTHFVVYHIDQDHFGTGHFSEEDINNLIEGKDWLNGNDLFEFLEFCGCQAEELLKDNLASKMQSLIQYFGPENICGTDFSTITEREAKELYLNYPPQIQPELLKD